MLRERKSPTRRTVLAGSIIGLGLAACSATVDYRYRFGMTVESDGRLISGSVVQKFRFAKPNNNWPSDVGVSRTVGEALALDLGGLGLLIATLAAWRIEKDGSRTLTTNAWTAAQANSEAGTGAGGLVRLRSPFFARLPDLGRVSVEAAELPVLVTFDDVDRPNTVRVIDPLDMGAGFRRPVRFVDAWVEATSDELTRGAIAKRVPAIVAMGKYSTPLQIPKIWPPAIPAEQLRNTDFITR